MPQQEDFRSSNNRLICAVLFRFIIDNRNNEATVAQNFCLKKCPPRFENLVSQVERRSVIDNRRSVVVFAMLLSRTGAYCFVLIVLWGRRDRGVGASSVGSRPLYLRLGEVDETALLLGEVLRGPLLVLPVALVLKHLNLIGAAEIIAATGRDVWHGSLAATAQRHHTALAHYMAPLSAAHHVTRVVTRGTVTAPAVTALRRDAHVVLVIVVLLDVVRRPTPTSALPALGTD
jgi:hypothetical protein